MDFVRLQESRARAPLSSWRAPLGLRDASLACIAKLAGRAPQLVGDASPAKGGSNVIIQMSFVSSHRLLAETKRKLANKKALFSL